MKILRLIFALSLFFFLWIQPVRAQGNTSTCIYYFYGDGCPQCEKVSPFLDQLSSKYPNLEIKRFEIYKNRDNALLLTQYFEGFGVSIADRGIPAVFISKSYLIGEKPILGSLENKIIGSPGASCPLPSVSNASGTSETPCSLEGTCTVGGVGAGSLLTIIGAALVDSINPCAITVLLMLFSALLLAGQKGRALRAGFAFILAVYLSYFIFGLGIFSAIRISGLSSLVYKLVGGLAIVVGLLNIKDYIWYGGGGFVMEIPRRWRHTLKDILSAVTSPVGAFIAGFAVTLFELPCTGGPYFFALGLLANKVTTLGVVPYLLLYNVFFVLPLIILTFLLYFGFTNVEDAAQWKYQRTRLLHLIAGLILTTLGVVTVFGLV